MNCYVVNKYLSCKPSSSKALGYNAISNKGRRKAPKTKITSENKVLKRRDREKLVATTQELMRNNVVVNWMLRKHCDHVSTFTFQAKTGDNKLNTLIETAFNVWGEAENCDRAMRHNIHDLIRLNEMGAVSNGDSALLKTTGYRLQGIESDLIAKPSDLDDDLKKLVDSEGLIKDEYSAVQKYIICTRNEEINGKKNTNTGISFSLAAPRNSVLFHGYFTRFNQTRGISPLAAAINTFLDIDECNEAQLIKAKKHAMFGLAIMSESDAPSGFDESDADTGDEPTEYSERYDFEMDMGYKLELEQGDKVDTFESKTPSTEYQEYIMLMIRICLFALDFPYTVFDSKGSSYTASKRDRAEYETSAKEKRRRNLSIMNRIAKWVMPKLLRSPEVADYMKKHNISKDLVKWEFIPHGTPWIEELKEIQAAAYRIATGLSSRTRELKQRNGDFNDVAEELEHEEQVIADKKLTIMVGQPGQQDIASIDAEGEAKEQENEIENNEESENDGSIN